MGTGLAGRVWGKYIILPDRFGFEEMKSIDHPLCGRIGWIGYQPYHQTQNQTQTTKLKNAKKKKIQSTSHKFPNLNKFPKRNGLSFFTQIHTITKYTHNKSQFSRLEISPNLVRIVLDLMRSHQIRRDLFQIRRDIARLVISRLGRLGAR